VSAINRGQVKGYSPNVERSPVGSQQFTIELGGRTADNPEQMNDSTSLAPAKTRRLWPWFVVTLVVVGVILSALAIRREAQRIKEQRQFQMPGVRN
jgi:hypothetical protein